jgi:hypothetical protein
MPLGRRKALSDPTVSQALGPRTGAHQPLRVEPVPTSVRGRWLGLGRVDELSILEKLTDTRSDEPASPWEYVVRSIGM